MWQEVSTGIAASIDKTYRVWVLYGPQGGRTPGPSVDAADDAKEAVAPYAASRTAVYVLKRRSEGDVGGATTPGWVDSPRRGRLDGTDARPDSAERSLGGVIRFDRGALHVPAGPSPDLTHEVDVVGEQLDEAAALAALPLRHPVGRHAADQDGEVVLVIEGVAERPQPWAFDGK
jgi:hypothetical protein